MVRHEIIKVAPLPAPAPRPASLPAERYGTASSVASLCKAIVVATAKRLGDRQYVRVEGWQAIATAHGCVASVREVRKVDGGVEAVAEIRRMEDGAVLAEAVGFVGEDEPTWYGGEAEVWEGPRGNRRKVKKVLPKRADYAIRAMAQTRAVSRVCRSVFAHVVVMMEAGLETTPAEEVEDDPPSRQEPSRRKPAAGVDAELDDARRRLFETLLPGAAREAKVALWRELLGAHQVDSAAKLTTDQRQALLGEMRRRTDAHKAGLAPDPAKLDAARAAQAEAEQKAAGKRPGKKLQAVLAVAHELGWDRATLDHFAAGELFDGRRLDELTPDELTRLAERLGIELEERRREAAEQAQAAAL